MAVALSRAWSLLEHHVVVLRWLPVYNVRASLAFDVLAAAAVVAVGAPEALVFASLAGVAPESGLYSTMVAPLVYGLLGTSSQVVLGPTALLSVLTSTSMPTQWGGTALVPGSAAYGAVASALSLCVGGVLLVLYLLRGRALVRFVGEPVLLGIVLSAGLIVSASQLAPLLGLPKCSASDAPGRTCTWLQTIVWACARLPSVRYASPVSAVASVGLLVLFKFGVPAARRWLPAYVQALRFAGPLVLVCVSIGVSAAVGSEGMQSVGLALVEPLPSGLPGVGGGWAALPPSAPGDGPALFVSAFAPAAIALIELLAIGGSAARLAGTTSPNAGQELFALSLVSLSCGLAQGFPGTSSMSRTAVALDAGVRSPLASVLAGLLIIPVLLWATPALSLLPKVAVAALIVVVVAKMLYKCVVEALALARTDICDALVVAVVVTLALCVEILPGFIAGLVLQWLVGLVRSGARSVVRVFFG